LGTRRCSAPNRRTTWVSSFSTSARFASSVANDGSVCDAVAGGFAEGVVASAAGADWGDDDAGCFPHPIQLTSKQAVRKRANIPASNHQAQEIQGSKFCRRNVEFSPIARSATKPRSARGHSCQTFLSAATRDRGTASELSTALLLFRVAADRNVRAPAPFYRPGRLAGGCQVLCQ